MDKKKFWAVFACLVIAVFIVNIRAMPSLNPNPFAYKDMGLRSFIAYDGEVTHTVEKRYAKGRGSREYRKTSYDVMIKTVDENNYNYRLKYNTAKQANAVIAQKDGFPMRVIEFGDKYMVVKPEQTLFKYMVRVFLVYIIGIVALSSLLYCVKLAWKNIDQDS